MNRLLRRNFFQALSNSFKPSGRSLTLRRNVTVRIGSSSARKTRGTTSFPHGPARPRRDSQSLGQNTKVNHNSVRSFRHTSGIETEQTESVEIILICCRVKWFRGSSSLSWIRSGVTLRRRVKDQPEGLNEFERA